MVGFYSFKGGVGRSTAAAITALLMAREGRRILLVDLDLEAPGLEGYFGFTNDQVQGGMVDLLLEQAAMGSRWTNNPWITSCLMSTILRCRTGADSCTSCPLGVSIRVIPSASGGWPWRTWPAPRVTKTHCGSCCKAFWTVRSTTSSSWTAARASLRSAAWRSTGCLTSTC
ncbi:MAG: tyrosine-protein kinase family protein [Deltaproteobacteria bacterium]|nr:tyrosine-protein kinase family protein [Deltaproteobacteria bacterium]